VIISGELHYLISRLQSLSTSAADISGYLAEALDYQARDMLTSGYCEQFNKVAQLRLFQYTQDPQSLITPLL
jgi:hypothetical protein